MSDEPDEDRSMDIANNSLGLDSCRKIYKPNRQVQDFDLGMKEILSIFKSDRMVVMRPKDKKRLLK